MDFYHAVLFDPHLCSFLLKNEGVACSSNAVLPYLRLTVAELHHYCTWKPPTAMATESPTQSLIEKWN